MASPTSAIVSGGRGVPGWVLLDRKPRLTVTDPDAAGMASEADVLLRLVTPPQVSTAFLDPALLPDPDAAAGDDTPPCRIEGADASGRLLLAFPSPRAPGESHLVVCRPVSSSGGDTAKGKPLPLPAFPEEEHRLAISPAAPTGIIADTSGNTGDGFLVAQLQSSNSAPVVAAALCYSSDLNQWTLKDVPGEEHWRDFVAKRVVSHDRAVDGNDARLVFVDFSRGLLLFHPRLAAASHFVDLPAAAQDGGGGEVEATVDSSEGKIVYVAFIEVDEGTMVGMWWLCQKELRWHQYSDYIVSDEDQRLLLRPVGIGPVHPNHLTRVFVILESSSFEVEVRSTRMVLKGASLDIDVLETGMVCPLSRDARKARTWNQTMDDAKELGQFGMDLLQESRKHLDKLPAAAELVGETLNLPLTSALVRAAKAANTLNTCIGFAESASSLLSKMKSRPSAPPAWEQYTTVSTEEEARRAIDVWTTMQKPADMKVVPAPGVTPVQLEALRRVFDEAGAQSLIEACDWVLVERAPNF